MIKADKGKAVYPADTVWGEIATMVREVTQKVGQKITDRIVGLAITAWGEAGVPLDASGEALYPFIALVRSADDSLRRLVAKDIRRRQALAHHGGQTTAHLLRE